MKQVQLLLLILLMAQFSGAASQGEGVTDDAVLTTEVEEVMDLDGTEESSADNTASPGVESTMEEEVVNGGEPTETGDETPIQEESTPESTATSNSTANQPSDEEAPLQSGPLVEIFGSTLLSLEMLSSTQAQLKEHLTTDALQGKKVIGVYFRYVTAIPMSSFNEETTHTNIIASRPSNTMDQSTTFVIAALTGAVLVGNSHQSLSVFLTK
mmetsp:Transcript_1744/g.3410  ORF Transcript_1744/g.3410 Transcript_1744/m.3410 type:complete len:212 (-) Transcript_1744:471-1106(-)